MRVPRNAADPEDPSNRRITVIIHYAPVTKADIDALVARDGKPDDGKEGDGPKPAATPAAKPGAAVAKTAIQPVPQPAAQAAKPSPVPAPKAKT